MTSHLFTIPTMQPFFKYIGEECLHPWVKVDQANRPLPPKSLSMLVGLTLKLDSLCIMLT